MKRKRLVRLAALLVLVLTCVLQTLPGQSANTHHVVTLTYVNGKVEVSPDLTKAAIGDVVELRSNQGEFILKFTNALTDDGPTVHSTNGLYQFTIQNAGYFACSMVINGKVVAAEYGGAIIIDH